MPVFERKALGPGAEIKGAAIVVEDETSTIVIAAFDAKIDAFGTIELTRRPD